MPEQYSDPQLQFGYWFTKHRVVMKAVVLSFFYLVFGILIFYNTKQIIDFYAYDEIGRLQREIANIQLLSGAQLSKYDPQPVQITNAMLVKRGGDAYDLIVEVQNPNQKHKINALSLKFTVGVWQSELVVDSFLPAEKKTVMLLNISDKKLVEAVNNGAQPRVDLNNVSWQRVKDIQWFNERGQFIGVGLVADNIITEQIGSNMRELRFDLVNNSIFNYRDVEIRAILYNKDQVVGVQKLSVNEIRSNILRSQSLRWFYAIPQVTNWRIELSTNIFNEDNILPFTIEQFE